MIDPFDQALSAFIDSLPEEHVAAATLLDESAPFSGQGDLPQLAELATMLRSVSPYQPRPEWVAASKARLMAAPVLPPEKRGFTWLGTMFMPLSQLSFPSLSLPRLGVPSPVFARAAMALVLMVTLVSVARGRAGRSPIADVTENPAPVPVAAAQQAIAATQSEVARLAQSQVAGVEIQGTPRDVVLLSQQIDLAELAIEDAPPADQPRLRSQLQDAVRAVRFEGQLEGVTNGTTLQVSGVAVQADPALVKQLTVGQPVSLLVRVGGEGKLQAVQVAPVASPAQSPAPASASAPPTPVAAPSSPPASSPPSPGPQSVAQNAATAGSSSPAVVAMSQPVEDAAPVESHKSVMVSQVTTTTVTNGPTTATVAAQSKPADDQSTKSSVSSVAPAIAAAASAAPVAGASDAAQTVAASDPGHSTPASAPASSAPVAQPVNTARALQVSVLETSSSHSSTTVSASSNSSSSGSSSSVSASSSSHGSSSHSSSSVVTTSAVASSHSNSSSSSSHGNGGNSGHKDK